MPVPLLSRTTVLQAVAPPCALPLTRALVLLLCCLVVPKRTITVKAVLMMTKSTCRICLLQPELSSKLVADILLSPQTEDVHEETTMQPSSCRLAARLEATGFAAGSLATLALQALLLHPRKPLDRRCCLGQPSEAPGFDFQNSQWAPLDCQRHCHFSHPKNLLTS